MTDQQPPDDKGRDGEQDGKGGGDVAALRKEAANYRSKLREAEADRDKYAERLTRMQRVEAERIASTKADGFRPLAAGDDLWRGEVELDALLDDDGNLDTDAVRATVGELAESRPHWLTTFHGDSDAGKGSSKPAGPSFGAALKAA